MTKFLHIGYPKTGSTLLQKKYFPNHPDINFINKSASDQYSTGVIHNKFAQTLFESGDSYFNRLLKDKLSNCDDKFRRLDEIPERIFSDFRSAFPEEKISLYSNEKFLDFTHLLGVPLEVFFREFLKKFSGFKIILTLRDQRTFLNSLYNENRNHRQIKGNVSVSPVMWLSQLEREGYSQYLEYDRVVEGFISAFGAENILILGYEELRDQPASYVNKICSFMGVGSYFSETDFDKKVNAKRTDGLIRYNKVIARLKTSPIGRIIPKGWFTPLHNVVMGHFSGGEGVQHFAPAQVEEIYLKYRDANRRLNLLAPDVVKHWELG